jgi:LDH2 family malate/lactate/ureidoglycolate dehydrogenase
MPGEIEERTKAQRLQSGLDIEETTWSQIVATSITVGLSEDRVEAILTDSPATHSPIR